VTVVPSRPRAALSATPANVTDNRSCRIIPSLGPWLDDPASQGA
jgi:hypothetical protein